jgi:hypothetical protein
MVAFERFGAAQGLSVVETLARALNYARIVIPQFESEF